MPIKNFGFSHKTSTNLVSSQASTYVAKTRIESDVGHAQLPEADNLNTMPQPFMLNAPSGYSMSLAAVKNAGTTIASNTAAKFAKSKTLLSQSIWRAKVEMPESFIQNDALEANGGLCIAAESDRDRSKIDVTRATTIGAIAGASLVVVTVCALSILNYVSGQKTPDDNAELILKVIFGSGFGGGLGACIGGVAGYHTAKSVNKERQVTVEG